jgi:Immunity protein 63
MKKVITKATSVKDIMKDIHRLAKEIDALEYLPFDESEYYGLKITKEGDIFHHAFFDKGFPGSIKRTKCPHELLYWVFSSVTFSKAYAFERDNRIVEQNPRRLVWQKQLELLGQLDSSWRDRQEREIEEILKKHPLDDSASMRVKLFKSLRDEGHPNDEAWEMACEKYPKPER